MTALSPYDPSVQTSSIVHNETKLHLVLGILNSHRPSIRLVRTEYRHILKSEARLNYSSFCPYWIFSALRQRKGCTGITRPTLKLGPILDLLFTYIYEIYGMWHIRDLLRLGCVLRTQLSYEFLNLVKAIKFCTHFEYSVSLLYLSNVNYMLLIH